MPKELYSTISRSLFLRLTEKEIPEWLDQTKSLKELVESPIKRERVFGRQAPEGTLLKLRDDPNWLELLFYKDGAVMIKRSSQQIEALIQEAKEARSARMRETLAKPGLVSLLAAALGLVKDRDNFGGQK